MSEKKYQVKSQSNGSYYALSFDAGDWTCACPDFKKRFKDCKHVFAILFSQKLRLEVMGSDPDGVPDAFIAECSKCGSSKTKRDGFRIVRGGRVQRYECRECGMKFALDKGFSRMKTDPKCVTVAMDLFFKGISLSKIQHHLSEFYGVKVNRSTILRWIQKFSALLNEYAEKHKAEVGEFWHADETMQNVNGEHRWVWNVMDHESRYLLASRLSKSRDVTDARKPLAEARKRADSKPRVVFTDGLQSYHEAINREFYEFNNPTLHVRVPGIRARINNNILERLNGTMRDRTKVLRAFDSSPTAQEVLDGFRFYYNHVRPHMGLNGQTPAQMAGFQVPDGPNLWMAHIWAARRARRAGPAIDALTFSSPS